MAKLIYSAITSLDGYIADEEGNFDWAAPDEEVHAFVNDLERPIGTYLYGRTRLPKVYGASFGFPWSFFFLIAASVTEMMQVAMNEWGHSLWITEEFFAAPFHWPFVAYGWLASGIFALWAESALRLLGIEKEAEEEAKGAPVVQTAA